jgi:hypothetical protein
MNFVGIHRLFPAKLTLLAAMNYTDLCVGETSFATAMPAVQGVSGLPRNPVSLLMSA